MCEVLDPAPRTRKNDEFNYNKLLNKEQINGVRMRGGVHGENVRIYPVMWSV